MARVNQSESGSRGGQGSSWEVLEAVVKNWGYFLKSSRRPLIGGF